MSGFSKTGGGTASKSATRDAFADVDSILDEQDFSEPDLLVEEIVSAEIEAHDRVSPDKPSEEAEKRLERVGEAASQNPMSLWNEAVQRRIAEEPWLRSTESRSLGVKRGPHLVVDNEGTPKIDAGEEAEGASGAGEEEPGADAEIGDDRPALNDADLLGKACPEFDKLLAQPAVFMTGELWGARDRRNTQDGDWFRGELPWIKWIDGGREGRNTWGLSRHPIRKQKEGTCIVLGESIDGARKAEAMKTMYAMGLDIDSGARLDDALKRLEKEEIACIVYTSYNHGKSGLTLKRDEVLRKLDTAGDLTDAQVHDFLANHSKDRYEPDFVKKTRIKNQKVQTKKGVVIELDTPPLDKFRLIFPLETPVDLIELAESHKEALEIWENKITGLAVNVLDVNFDTSCTDPSRLYFTPGHPKDAEEWYCAIVRGKPLNFDAIKAYKKSSYAKQRDKLNPFEQAGGAEEEGDAPPQCYTPSGKSLNDWHSQIGKQRFLLANLLEDECSDKIRHAGGESQGHVHTECPFEHEHSNEGGTGTMAVNCLDNVNEYWTWFCKHDACTGRHKLKFLEKALQEEWFDEKLLTDEKYVLPAEDGDGDEVAEEAWKQGPLKPEDCATVDGVEAAIKQAGIDQNSNDDDVRTFLHRARAGGIDKSGRERINIAIRGATLLKTRDLTSIWKELDEKATKAAAAQRRAEADREYERRLSAPRGAYVALEDATEETVEAAAENAKWLPSNFEQTDGWFYRTNFDEPEKSIRVCRAFEVVGISYREGGKDIEVTIRFLHRSSDTIGVTESRFPLADTYKDSGVLVAKLVGDGLMVNPQGGNSASEGTATGALLYLLRSIETDREALIRTKPGWLEDKSAYVAPTGEVIQKHGDPREYILDDKMRVNASKAGSLDEWKRAVNTICLGTNGEYGLMGVLTGIVGCLADFIDYSVSLIFAFEGPSSRGKTSALNCGVSALTIPDHSGLLMKADFTATATETVAMRGNGAIVALDDGGTSRVTPVEKQRLVLQWAEGQGRGRGNKDGRHARRCDMAHLLCPLGGAGICCSS